MLDFLENIFGENIKISAYNYPNGIQNYLKDNYKTQKLTCMGKSCVLLIPLMKDWRLPTLKKQFVKFQLVSDLPCALCLENLTSMQRRNLLENQIPFVAKSQQVYLPFWGCAFTEKMSKNISIGDYMAPGTQLVFLYFYYNLKHNTINLTQLAYELNLSKATCTRAIQDLEETGLLVQNVKGTNKWISMKYDKQEFLKKGIGRMKSPVGQIVYAKQISKKEIFYRSGIKALAEISMVSEKESDGAFAISAKKYRNIDNIQVISKQDYEDFGGNIIELWNYNPEYFAEEGHVDEISLLLSLRNNKDERIQQGLDVIRKKHGLSIDSDE